MRKFLNSSFFSYGLFWSWNLLYLILFAALEINIGFAIHIISHGFHGLAPIDFTIIALMAYLIPLVSIIMAVTLLKNDKNKLVALFYGVEVPLTLLCLLRLFLVREMTAGTFHLFALFVVGMITFFFELIRVKNTISKSGNYLNLILNTLLLLIGIYISCLLIFYLPPLGAGIIYVIIDIFKSGNFAMMLQMGIMFLIGGVFIVYTMTMLLGLPIAIFYYYFTTFYQRFTFFSSKFGYNHALLTVGSFVVLNIILFYILNWGQQQTLAFQLLEEKNWTKNKITTVSNEEKNIKDGLLNAYLSPYRYLSEEKHNHTMASIYSSAFDSKKDKFELVQNCHNVFLKPFLYEGERMNDERKKAGELYEKYFDASIQKSEREAIKKALKSTWERDGVEAGLLNIDEEKVLVVKQELKIVELNDKAQIELHEVYQNLTYEQQEVLYYFSLPEHAVVTGLWLSDNETKKYSYRVSPRGAAQQVYKEEVRRRIDPSLLEQVGPGQYRLRAFPIQAKSVKYKNRGISQYDIEDGEQLHLWLSYEVLADGQSWPLPKLLQKRNVFCNDNTLAAVNGTNLSKNNDSDWLPISIKTSKPIVQTKHVSRISDSLTITAIPSKIQTPKLNLSANKFAVLIDGSYSMNSNKNELFKTLAWLKDKGIDSKTDVYIAGLTSELKQFTDVTENTLDFFGNISHLGIIHQFDSLRKSKNYDAVIMLTDQGDYELSSDSLAPIHFPFPVYMIHLDKKLPYAYDDALLETMEKSNGKSYLQIEDIYLEKSLKQQMGANFLLYEQGYIWSTDSNTYHIESDIQKMGARQFIKSFKLSSDSTKISRLDFIHSLAKNNSIVTPYSSMIVLVNQEQHEKLDKAELQKDRFNREVETGKEVTTTSDITFSDVSGTPEPEEWILILIALAFVFYSYYVHRIKKKKSLNVN